MNGSYLGRDVVGRADGRVGELAFAVGVGPVGVAAVVALLGLPVPTLPARRRGRAANESRRWLDGKRVRQTRAGC